MPQPLTQCRRGHPFPENAYVKRNGHRFCKRCCADKSRDAARRKARAPERFLRTEDRIWLYIDKTPGHGPKGDCWVWTRSTTPAGYGVTCRDGKRIIVSRLILEAQSGQPLPEGIEACHHCDFPPCCRPSHLFAGTRSQNIADMIAKNRGPDMRAVALYRENPKGVKNGQAKLTEAQAREILRRGKAGEDLHLLAAEMSVSWATTYRIVRRLGWKHL